MSVLIRAISFGGQAWICGLLLVAFAGCSESPVAARAHVVPAGGTLTYQGRPVAGAHLTFLGNDPAEPAFAVTDAQGRFKCMTNDSSVGVRPGDYSVTVSKPQGGIPKKYATAPDSPLQVTVEDDEEANEFRLELED
jgi:hypothetical protein